jgi:branched-subunit amino acid transport protein
MTGADLLLTGIIVVCGAGSFVWRGVGVWVADRINVRSEWFRWDSCVAFAMIAGLVSRVVLLPVGELAHTTLARRAAGVAIALLAYRIGRRSMLLGVLSGAAALPILEWLAIP